MLSICVEVCSAAFFLDNDPGVLISACLFGDGAGAVVLTNLPRGRRPLELKTICSLLKPEARDSLRFECTQGMLRNVLSPAVPSLAAESAKKVLQYALSSTNVDRSQISVWVFHPGGRDVLTALKQELNLTSCDVRWSEEVLAQFGNLSSPSVFFVLQAALANAAPNGYSWMSSFGAGFSCHGALLKFG